MLKLFLGCSWKILNSLAAESRFNDLHRSECFPPTTFLLLERIRKLAPFVAFLSSCCTNIIISSQNLPGPGSTSWTLRRTLSRRGRASTSSMKKSEKHFWPSTSFCTSSIFAFARSQVNCSSGERLWFAWPNKISSDSLDPNGVGLP